MARIDLGNLQVSNYTWRHRLRETSWNVLRALVVCYLAWDLSAYLIKFWETRNVWRLIVPALLTAALVYTLQLADLRRRRWLIVPLLLALTAPIVLHALGQRVLPNGRFLSDLL